MRILCLHLPNWPVQRLLVAERQRDPHQPLVLSARDSRRGQLVTACNAAARRRGARAGMPLAEATALLGDYGQTAPADPVADLAALAQLAERCERYSPHVGWETTDPAPPQNPRSLLLDITGIGRLFGGEELLLAEIQEEFEQLGYAPRIAIGATIGEAWAVALAPREQAATRDLAALPITTLRLPDETIDLLAQLGITTVGELCGLPRASFKARFGEVLLRRLDQLTGQAAETILAYRPPPEFIAERVLEYPADSRPLVEKVVASLIERLASDLAARRHGAMQLVCRLAGRPPLVLEVGLFRPSADPRHLRQLVEMQLEQPLPGPIGRITLSAPLVAPLENRQQELFGGSRHEAERQFELLVDRLHSRLGAAAVLRAQLTADPLPERAVEEVPYLPASRSRSKAQRLPRPGRPLLLCSPPEALDASSVVPDGPPVAFWREREQERVARWWGPERIESGWWRGPSVRRDYYRVETETGRRYWLFRDLFDGRWFLHGEFD
jgi:protein ImuB